MTIALATCGSFVFDQTGSLMIAAGGDAQRALLYACIAGMAIALFALTHAFSGGAGTAVGGITIVALMVYVGCFAFGLGPITWLIISEIYPLAVRGRAMSIATLANWAANFIVSFVFLTMIKAFGTSLTFAIYGVVCLITIWFVRVFIRETRNLELDSISGNPKAAAVLPVA